MRVLSATCVSSILSREDPQDRDDLLGHWRGHGRGIHGTVGSGPQVVDDVLQDTDRQTDRRQEESTRQVDLTRTSANGQAAGAEHT